MLVVFSFIDLSNNFFLWKGGTFSDKLWKRKIEKGKKLHKFFAKDGIICEEEYRKSGTRILFILKEPNIMKDLIDENYDDDQRIFYNDFFNNKFYDESLFLRGIWKWMKKPLLKSGLTKSKTK